MRMCAERRSSPEDAGSSFVAVWELVQPKLWCVVCVVWERAARAPTQDLLEVVEGRERASMWMCA